MVSKNSTATDMDQFMNDFLEGKYLDEEKPKHRHSSSSRKSKTDEEPKRGLRRTKTNEDVPSSRFRSQVRRTKSGDASNNIRRRSSRKSERSSDGDNSKQLDPQMVLRMMEMYADMDDSQKAESYLHYGMEKKEGDVDEANLAMPPDMILVRTNASNQAA